MIRNRFYLTGRKGLALVVCVCAYTWIPNTAVAKKPKAKDTYYTVAPTFLPAPKSVGGKSWNVKNFGPVGIGITLKPQNPGFQMVISNVEEGSPPTSTAMSTRSKKVRQPINIPTRPGKR